MKKINRKYLVIIGIIILVIFLRAMIYQYPARVIDNNLNDFCSDKSNEEFNKQLAGSLLDKNDKCVKILNIYKKFDMGRLWGYKFCADFVTEKGNDYQIYGYMKINFLTRNYSSVILGDKYKCNPNEYY